MPSTPPEYDAFLLVSFGGPEGPEQVMPFLENVLRGKNVPRQRMLEVAEHYQQFGGVSPINRQNRDLIAALQHEFDNHNMALPVYWGNRNWHPLLSDTLRQMAEDGVRRALAFFTSAYSSYSGCRQYREDIVRAREEAGEKAPAVEKLRAYFNHPGFLLPMAEQVTAALAQVPADRRANAQLVFTAHSIPQAMADGCRYVEQLQEASRIVSEHAGKTEWKLVFQSRSGPPPQPCLEPDVCDYIRDSHAAGMTQDLVLVPIGFVSDHLEVLFDLDTEARELCEQLGIFMVRAATVGTHPRFVQMVRELVIERTEQHAERETLGNLGPAADACPDDCCLSGRK